MPRRFLQFAIVLLGTTLLQAGLVDCCGPAPRPAHSCCSPVLAVPAAVPPASVRLERPRPLPTVVEPVLLTAALPAVPETGATAVAAQGRPHSDDVCILVHVLRI